MGEIDDQTDPEGVLIAVDEDDDDNSFFANYDFTDSAAPISMLIIGILFIALTGLLTGISKGLATYSSVNNLDSKSGWIKTAFTMFIVRGVM